MPCATLGAERSMVQDPEKKPAAAFSTCNNKRIHHLGYTVIWTQTCELQFLPKNLFWVWQVPSVMGWEGGGRGILSFCILMVSTISEVSSHVFR